MKFKIGDKVLITAGKDKGKTGKITKVLPRLSKVLVEGVNKYKKHVKAQGEKKPGGIVEIEKPLSLANVSLLCPTCKQQTRIGFSIEKSGSKTRICRKCKATL
jgi:large subunit ribosomal protein L24